MVGLHLLQRLPDTKDGGTLAPVLLHSASKLRGEATGRGAEPLNQLSKNYFRTR